MNPIQASANHRGNFACCQAERTGRGANRQIECAAFLTLQGASRHRVQVTTHDALSMPPLAPAS